MIFTNQKDQNKNIETNTTLPEYKQRALGEFDVVLKRKATGFGFRILQGEDQSKKVTIGDIVEGTFLLI